MEESQAGHLEVPHTGYQGLEVSVKGTNYQLLIKSLGIKGIAGAVIDR